MPKPRKCGAEAVGAGLLSALMIEQEKPMTYANRIDAFAAFRL